MRKSELNPDTIKNLYIHIPFCKSKCYYCSFISYAGKTEQIETYFNSLNKEMYYYLNQYPSTELETIYIGGGTPSVADFELYRNVFKTIKNSVKISPNAEITMEINPAAADYDYLKNIRDLGINRLSIGVQSFDDEILKLINRTHSSEDALKTVKTAKKAGFNNISIDLIYGLPSQSVKNWEDTLNTASSLEINHVSTYGLKIEENTEFYKNTPANLPDDEVQSNIYLTTIEFLEKNNFNHYEISNFCKTGFESKHNLCYWKNKQYFGLGLAAHGYINGIRYFNTENLEDYIKNPVKHLSENKITETEKLEEAIFLGLRLAQGINSEEFKSKYGIDIYEKYSKIIEKHSNYGLLSYENGVLRLTKQGFLLSNSVLADFL